MRSTTRAVDPLPLTCANLWPCAKVFTLVYKLPKPADIYQRFPGVDGSVYYIGGAGINYQRLKGITLAPIRLGVGLRAGASVGYVHYRREKSINPF